MKGRKKSGMLIMLAGCWGILSAQNDSAFSQQIISSFNLYQTSPGQMIHLSPSDPGRRLTLFIFLSPECPLCQNSTLILNSFFDAYKMDISFYGIMPGKAYSVIDINKFAGEYDVKFPLFIDSSRALSGYLKATVTPQVILLNDRMQLVYKGAIDDALMELGKRRVKVTQEYLKEAILQGLDNKTALVKRTKAVGCKINDY